MTQTNTHPTDRPIIQSSTHTGYLETVQDARAWYNRVVAQEFATRSAQLSREQREAQGQGLLRLLGEKVDFGALWLWMGVWAGGWLVGELIGM